MSNLPADLANLVVQQQADVETWGKGSDFVSIPTLKFLNSGTDVVKRGDVPANSYSLTLNRDSKPVNLGKEVDAVLLAVRVSAADFSGDKAVIIHDQKDARWAEIEEKASSKVREVSKNYAYGPEVLMYLPEKDCFASFWCSNASARNEARNTLKPNLGKTVTLSGKIITSKENTWGCFTATESKVPANIPEERLEEAKKILESFLKK